VKKIDLIQTCNFKLAIKIERDYREYLILINLAIKISILEEQIIEAIIKLKTFLTQ